MYVGICIYAFSPRISASCLQDDGFQGPDDPFQHYDWLDQFGCLKDAFGLKEPELNAIIVPDPAGVYGNVIQVIYPEGSWSPSATRAAGIPIGGKATMSLHALWARLVLFSLGLMPRTSTLFSFSFFLCLCLWCSSGAQFEGDLMNLVPQNYAILKYSVRLEPGFDCVRGGKLPGLYGGIGNSDDQVSRARMHAFDPPDPRVPLWFLVRVVLSLVA